jgi:hypothetical protein
VKRIMLVLTVALVMAAMVLATPTTKEVDAHSTPWVTRIFVDGELVKRTPDDHFTYTQRLAPGCYTVKVVRRNGGGTVIRTENRFCSDEVSKLVVKVNDRSVSTTTTPL